MVSVRTIPWLLLVSLVPTVVSAQVPSELREAMRERDRAVAQADAPTWDRLTADDFTVVQEDGILMTKPERLTQLKGQKPTTPLPAQQEQVKRYREAFVRRFRSGDVWVLEVWAKDARGWRAQAVQVTTAAKK